MRKTKLAGKAGLNYVVCMKYLSFMRMLDWVRNVAENDIDYIAITELGRQLIPVFGDYLEGKSEIINRHPSNLSISGIENAITAGTALERLKRISDQSVDNSSNSSSHVSNDVAVKQKSEPKIMLVDDEPDALLTYKSFLVREGYSVEAFENPEKAIMRFASMKPGYYRLVITDIRMNQMNGIKLYQRIKAMDQEVNIIFVTALDAAEELVTILSPQPAIILRKPIEQQEFNNCVKSILSLDVSQ